MDGYRVNITLLAPTMIGSGPARGNHVDSLRYVPGGTLRGALAQRWILENGTPDTVSDEQLAEFGSIFEGDISFGPAHAVGSRIRGLSELHLKYGWRDDLEPVVDIAQQEAPVHLLDYEAGKGQIDGIDTVDVARTALDESERAKDGQLYSREALPAGLRLVGTIGGRHPWLDALSGSTLRIRVGGRRSVNGSAEVRIDPFTPDPHAAPATAILVRAVSPVILLDHMCRPCSDFTADAFGAALGCRPDEVSIEQTWVRSDVVHGWHIASGLPKPDDLALVIGSTAKIVVPAGVDLNELEHVGIGARTAEGFGRLIIDPSPPSAARTVADVQAVDAPCLAAFAQIRRHWFGVSTAKGARSLLRSALDKRTAEATVSVSELIGRSAERSMPQQYQFEFDELVNRLSAVDLDDLIALVDAELIREEGQ